MVRSCAPVLDAIHQVGAAGYKPSPLGVSGRQEPVEGVHAENPRGDLTCIEVHRLRNCVGAIVEVDLHSFSLHLVTIPLPVDVP